MASASTHISVPMSKVSGTTVVQVRLTGLRWWMFRLRFALWLVTVAGWVAPIRFDIEIVK